MRLNRIILPLLVCAMWLYGCATPSTPRSSEPQPTTTKIATTNETKPAISASARRDYVKALAAIKAKRYRQAEEILLKIVAVRADLAGPYVNLGIVYYRGGRLKEAERALRKAIAINPERPDSYNHLGIVLRSSGRFVEARQAYERALAIDPSYAYVHLNLGILYDLYLFDAAKALNYYESYQRLLSTQDEQVSKWIVDLQRRMQREKKTAMRQDA